MKTIKSILLAAIAAAAVGSATAQTVVHRNQVNLAGSTAFRAVHLRELHSYALSQGYTLVASDGNPSAGSGSAALYIKDSTNGSAVIRDAINARFIGSEGGTLVAGSKATQGFYGLGQRGVGSSPTTTCTNQMSATITYSDCDQSVGVFSGNRGAKARVSKLTSAGQLPALNFAFCTTQDFPANNITDRQASALLMRGHLPLSFFTGNPNDRTNGVFPIGRNLDSGTRTAILTEVGVGALTKLNQYDFNTNNRTISITPAGTFPVRFLAGDGGDDSGGTLCSKVALSTNLFGTNVITNSSLNTNYTGRVYLIGYAGANDINGRRLKALSYNGIAPFHPSPNTNTTIGFQTNFNGIANGTYSLFSIGRVYFNAANAPTGTDRNLIPTIARQLATNIATNTTTTFGSGHTAISDLNITRSVEGSFARPR